MTQSRARAPGLLQGLVLISLAWVATAAAVALGPVLPTIAQTFKDTPAVDVKIPLVAAGPALLVALLAVPFGFLIDKIGRRALLLASLLLYGAAGMAPLLLHDLDHIVVSRFTVGLAEAAIMTSGTALISDYFEGRRRERWLAVQAGAAPLTAVFFVILGGALGAFGWRAPFFIYAWGLILIPLVLAFLWEPQRQATNTVAANDALAPFNWGKPLWIALVVVFSMIAFMVTVVQFSFLLTERGMTAPQDIGLWSAVVTVANPLGALAFGLVPGRTSTRLVIAYALFTAGFACMALVTTTQAAIVGAFIANLGAGVMLPTAITWLLSSIPPHLRGRGSGLWTSANFLGQFLGPLTILGLQKATGSLSGAILAVGAGCAFAALAAVPSMIRGFGKPAAA